MVSMVLHGFYGIAWILWYCMGVNAIQKREKRGQLWWRWEFWFLADPDKKWIQNVQGREKVHFNSNSPLTPSGCNLEISTEYDNRKANSRPLPPSVTFWSPLLFYTSPLPPLDIQSIQVQSHPRGVWVGLRGWQTERASVPPTKYKHTNTPSKYTIE